MLLAKEIPAHGDDYDGKRKPQRGKCGGKDEVVLLCPLVRSSLLLAYAQAAATDSHSSKRREKRLSYEV